MRDKLKIFSLDGDPRSVRVYDSKSGHPIPMVTKARWSIACRDVSKSSLTLDVALVEMEVVGLWNGDSSRPVRILSDGFRDCSVFLLKSGEEIRCVKAVSWECSMEGRAHVEIVFDEMDEDNPRC